MASAAKLIERHMVLWELKRKLQDLYQRPGRCMYNGVAYGPCLLISRERGSGGSTIARMAGERLGWQVFDREILDQIADLAQVRHQLSESIAEPARSRLQQYWASTLKPEHLDDEAYYLYLRKVVMTLGHHGDVVLVGRGANYILPSEGSMRVRVVAPLGTRIERLSESEGLPIPEARAQIERFDAERDEFARNWFQREAHSPLNYDLVLNTAELTLEEAADIVINASENKLRVPVPASRKLAA